MRFLSEPLFQLKPRLPFHGQGDHTALGYEPISSDHPLAAAYQSLTIKDFKASPLKSSDRDDPGWQLCLVKEVHALLGTEGLLRLFQTPTLLLLRDPVYVVDSLFAAQTLKTPYLEHEARAVQDTSFLNRFLPGRQDRVAALLADAARGESREEVVLSRLVAVYALQQMFRVLAAEFDFVTLLRYEDLCEAPSQHLPAAARALSIPWDNSMDAYLRRTLSADSTSLDPYSVMRNTSAQNTRPLKFLSPEEAGAARDTLEKLELSGAGRN